MELMCRTGTIADFRHLRLRATLNEVDSDLMHYHQKSNPYYSTGIKLIPEHKNIDSTEIMYNNKIRYEMSTNRYSRNL
jgi:hypothetical protein